MENCSDHRLTYTLNNRYISRHLRHFSSSDLSLQSSLPSQTLLLSIHLPLLQVKRLALQLKSVKKQDQPHVLRWTFPKDFPPYIHQGRSPCCSMLHTSIGYLLRCHSWSSERIRLTYLNIHQMIIIRKSLYKESIYFYLRAGIQIMIKLCRKVIFFWQLKEIVSNFRMQENKSLQM